jgi:hypothetical protein
MGQQVTSYVIAGSVVPEVFQLVFIIGLAG